MATRVQHIKLGARFPTLRLQQQVAYSLKLLETDKAGLAKEGWKDERSEELNAEIGRMNALFSDQKVAKDDVPAWSARVRQATAAAKEWKRKILLYAGNAFEDEPDTRDDFDAGGTIGSSTPKLVAYLTKVIPIVEKHAAALKAWQMPEGYAGDGKRRLAELSAADAAQELAIKSLPVKSADLYEAKGKIYKLVKKFNRCGRLLHDGDTERVAKYNMDILNRHGAKTKESKTLGGGSTGV